MSPLPAGYAHPLAMTTLRGRKLNYSTIRHQSWVNGGAIDVNGILESISGPDDETLTPALVGAFVTDGVEILDFPRSVIVTVTHSTSIVVCSGVITGTDIYGNVVTNTWAVTATGTSKTSESAQCFARVTGVTLFSASDASGNSVFIGTGDILGLDAACASDAILGEHEDGSGPTAGAVVPGSSSANADK